MGKIRVGAAKMNITPPADWFPFPERSKTGGPHRFSKATDVSPQPVDVFMDIYTRMVVIDDGTNKFLFLNLDSGPSLDQEFKDQINEKYGIPPENILGVWTHNHSTQIFWNRHAPEGDMSYKYFLLVEKAVFDGIDKCFANMKPAKWGFGEGESYINVNRDVLFEDGHWMEGTNFRGPIDRTLAVLKFVDYDGKLIAAVTNYGCHPNTLRPELPDADGKRKLCPDFVGVAEQLVEDRYGNDAVCLWTNGSSGDVNPVCTMGYLRKYWTDGYNEPINPPYGFAYQNMMTLGMEHGIDTYRTIESIDAVKTGMTIKTAADIANLPRQKYEGEDNYLDWAITDNICRKRAPECMINDRNPPKESRGKMVPDPEHVSPVHMQVAVFGDVAWVGISGEPYTEMGWAMKAASPFKKTVVISHSHDNAIMNGSYLLSDNAKDHDTFSRYQSMTLPGDNDERVCECEKGMFKKILGLE